ncbi:hypothetical protein ASPTUDRAFT_354103 [Aspergillus tubingensis CBS 134.48]|uniref:Uncharacterized protein n=1 Tax=Aspergillus tubingensis (strain CBS 134.48) TaxID=767770 RepID=A0A1L9NHP7_ASPTC|nr:hypothetical protein ASPTUDRAFT_354103 [Aspergillus tubingensis CBS 134.48]
MSTWPIVIRNNISTRPEQTGAIKGGHLGSRGACLWLNQAIISCSILTGWRYRSAPNRWRGIHAWRRAVRRLATPAIPERPTNLGRVCMETEAKLQGCGQHWHHWTRSILSVPWAFMECALAAATARSA